MTDNTVQPARKPRASRNYINNRHFYEALVKYKADYEADNTIEMPTYIGQSILQICTRLSTKSNFSGYSTRDEMVGDAIENCISAVRKFNPERSDNPFAYFTQIAKNAMIRRIGRENIQLYVKHKNFERTGMAAELDDLGTQTARASLETSYGVIEKFETKHAEKRQEMLEKRAAKEEV